MTEGTLHPQRVLIVGWGFIGSAIGRRFVKAGVAVRALTPDIAALPKDLRVEAVEGRVETATFARALRGVDHVIYSAGGAHPPSAERDPLDDAARSILPTIAMMETLRSYPGVSLTYLASGGTVYGDPLQNPVSESAPMQPMSAYGISRLAGELYARKYSITHDIPVQIARCANVYGPGQPADRGQGAVAVFMHRIREGLPITIYGDGSSIRDYIHVDDVADAVTKLAMHGVPGDLVNVGSGRGHSTLEVLEVISDALGIPAVVEYKPERRHDVKSIVLDIAKLRSLIAFDPRSLEVGIDSLVKTQNHKPSVVSDVA